MIFYVSSWDVMEAITFIATAFWLMIGSHLFLFKKIDMTLDAYDQLIDREREKVSKHDPMKEKFLEEYL